MRMGGHCIHWTISIHSLRMEGDFSGWLRPVDPEIFQSTPSAWRETLRNRDLPRPGIHFNPLPPHGGRHSKGVSISEMIDISIHSLRMEGDALDSVEYRQAFIFQSTPSAWRETGEEVVKYVRKSISIHSLRMEGDTQLTPPITTAENFNPLPPHGGRLFRSLQKSISWIFQSTPSAWRETFRSLQKSISWIFQSTPSAWRETNTECVVMRLHSISIHSLRMEGDQRVQTGATIHAYFNPLPPHGGRHLCCCDLTLQCGISIHSLRMEGDRRCHTDGKGSPNFNPLPPHGGRPH